MFQRLFAFGLMTMISASAQAQTVRLAPLNPARSEWTIQCQSRSLAIIIQMTNGDRSGVLGSGSYGGVTRVVGGTRNEFVMDLDAKRMGRMIAPGLSFQAQFISDKGQMKLTIPDREDDRDFICAKRARATIELQKTGAPPISESAECEIEQSAMADLYCRSLRN